jgi:hypothetical protein
LIFTKLRPLGNKLISFNIKMGVSLEPVGVAQNLLHQSFYLVEYYRFDSSLDFYGDSATDSPTQPNFRLVLGLTTNSISLEKL